MLTQVDRLREGCGMERCQKVVGVITSLDLDGQGRGCTGPKVSSACRRGSQDRNCSHWQRAQLPSHPVQQGGSRLCIPLLSLSSLLLLFPH